MELFYAIGFVALGLTLLVFGGDAMLKGAVGLARIVKLTPAVIGLTVVAIGTSIPELFVSAFAAFQGKTDIAVGNVVGSNVFNIALILGITAMIRPMKITGKTIQLEYPVLAIVSWMMISMCQDGTVNWIDAVLCLAVYIGFTAYLVSLVRKEVTGLEKKEFQAELDERAPELDDEPPISGMACAIYLIVGVALLAGGAQATIEGAVRLAKMWGWDDRLIGLTIISAGTGLPEVFTSLISAIKGRSDVAIGNVIGSNLFNILGVFGITAIIYPLPVNPMIMSQDVWWMIGITLILGPMMIWGRNINRLEGAILFGLYSAYMYLLISSSNVN